MVVNFYEGAKSQMEFYKLNNEFQDVKAEAINIVSAIKENTNNRYFFIIKKFLANEFLNLKKHISERTVNILNQVKTFENANKQKLYMGLINEASKEIDRVNTFFLSRKIKCFINYFNRK